MTQTVQQTAPRAGVVKHDLEQLRQDFARDGYLIFRNVIGREPLEQLRRKLLEEFEAMKQSGRLFAGGGNISGHLNCFPGAGSRFVYETLEEQGIIGVVKALDPNAVRLPNVGCNFNLPKSVTQHYHVDSDFTAQFMIVNIAVVDTDLENGAIDVVPGTHGKFYKFWRFALERPHKHAKRLPLKQGDVLVRTSNLWHRGMPNFTDLARPMLALTWEKGGSTKADPYQDENGKIAFRTNWYRTNFLGRLRERTFVAAPITYSTYRFVRSLFGSKGY